MPIVGFFLILIGLVMNVQVLRRQRGQGVEASQVMASAPWLISVGLIALGIVLLLVVR